MCCDMYQNILHALFHLQFVMNLNKNNSAVVHHFVEGCYGDSGFWGLP